MNLCFSDDPMLSVFSFAYWLSDRILCLLILMMFNSLNFFPLWLMFDIKSNDNLCPTKKRPRTTLNVGFCHGLLIKITHCLPWKEKLLELCFYFPLKTNLLSFSIKRRKSEIMIHWLSRFPQSQGTKHETQLE